MSEQAKCLPECRTKFDMRRAPGKQYYVIHSPRCQAGCSEPLPNPIDEANAPALVSAPEAPKCKCRGGHACDLCDCDCHSAQDAHAAEGEIDFVGVETWVKSRHPGIDKGDWQIARAYLALKTENERLKHELFMATSPLSSAVSIPKLSVDLAASQARVRELEAVVANYEAMVHADCACGEDGMCDFHRYEKRVWELEELIVGTVSENAGAAHGKCEDEASAILARRAAEQENGKA
jgi:hypothetical protein